MIVFLILTGKNLNVLDISCHYLPPTLDYVLERPMSSNTLLLGFHGTNVLKMTKSFLGNGHNVTLLTFTHIKRSEWKSLVNTFNSGRRRSLRIITSFPPGDPSAVSNMIKIQKINEVHVVLDLDDFDPHLTAGMFEASVDRYVQLLQGLSQLPKYKYPVYIHLPDIQNQQTFIGFNGRSAVHRGRLKNSTHITGELSNDGCDGHSSYKNVQNIFIEQIHLYSNVFRNIHDMDIKFIMLV